MNRSGRIDTAADNLRRPPLLGRWPRNIVLKRLENISQGGLNLTESNRKYHLGSDYPENPVASIKVLHPAFYSSVALGGSLGAAESYIRGEWESDNLVELVRLMVRNRDVLEGIDGGLAALAGPLRRFYHWLNRNSTSGSRQNIESHYDLSNEFYSLFLDPTMAYSSAVFPSDGSTLEEGSKEKFDRLCRMLELGPSDHVLEIGTGWGGFALHAAENYGCRVTTTTISSEQYSHSRKLFRRHGLQDRIELLNEDYRSLRGTYSKLVSIEMIEAVGHRYIPEFFSTCNRLLSSDGLMALQGITINGQHYQRYINSVDFIQRYIFPGSCLISVDNVLTALSNVTDMRLLHLDDITGHYARTLQMWRKNFLAKLHRVRQLGFSENFIRMWHYYLCYCEGGFAERFIGEVQLLLAKSRSRRELIPINREQTGGKITVEVS